MSIDQRASGLWRARWRETPGGPQQSKTFKLKRDAKQFLNDTESRIARGESVDLRASRQPLSEWWDTWTGRQLWRPGTVTSVRYAWRRIEPVLGRRALGSIRQADVSALVAKLLDDGCAPSTARLAVQKLRGCARAAVAEGLIGRDFTLGVRVPDSAPTRLVIPEAVDVAALLEAADDRMAIAVLLGADAGLRLSELLGLSSDRVSWLSSKPTVTVDRQSAKSVLGAPVTFTAPKTASSVRDIPVPAELLGDLAARLERTGLGEEGLLLHDGGRGWTKNRFHDAWRSLRSEAGLDGVRFHDLRHYFCSRLLAGGVNIAAVARAAGHSSPSVTLDTYSHVLGDDHEKIRAVLGGAESWLSPGGAGTGIAESV